MGKSFIDKIQAKLELFRLEQRYTRRRHRRSTFISNAVYVDGEYVYQTPYNTGSSSGSFNADALHGDNAGVVSAYTRVNPPPESHFPPTATNYLQPQQQQQQPQQQQQQQQSQQQQLQLSDTERKRLSRFGSFNFGNTSFTSEMPSSKERWNSMIR